MDEAKKTEIRKWAKKRYRTTLVGLPVLALLWIGWWGYNTWQAGADHGVRADIPLSRAGSEVTMEFARFYFQQTQKLIAYPPPPQASAEAEWAARIEQHFGQPTAVFRANGSDVRWVRMPEKFRADSTLLDKSLHLEENTEARGKLTPRNVGDMDVVHWAVPGKPSPHAVWMVGPKSSTERWGAVLAGGDYWNTMVHELQRGDSAKDLDDPAYVLRDAVELSAQGKQLNKPGLRIIRSGAVVFDSPGLDTTQYCYTSGSPEFTLKLYEPKTDHLWARMDRFRLGYVSLFGAIFILLPLVPIRRWYKKVMLLTEAEG